MYKSNGIYFIKAASFPSLETAVIDKFEIENKTCNIPKTTQINSLLKSITDNSSLTVILLCNDTFNAGINVFPIKIIVNNTIITGNTVCIKNTGCLSKFFNSFFIYNFPTFLLLNFLIFNFLLFLSSFFSEILSKTLFK